MNVVDESPQESSAKGEAETKPWDTNDLDQNHGEDLIQQKELISHTSSHSETEKQHGETETETENEIKLVIDSNFYQDDEENEEFEATESIDTLKAKQKEAIENLDFHLANQIQQQIDNIKEIESNNFIGSFKTTLTNTCNKIGKKLLIERANTYKEFYGKEVEIRTKLSESFQQLRDTHLKQLTDFEKKMFKEFRQKMEQSIPQYDVLIDRAKLTATRGDFSKAQELQDQANDIKSDEEKRREDFFRGIYNNKMDLLLAHQKEELANLEKRFESELDFLNRSLHTRISQLNAQFKKDLDTEYKKMFDSINKSGYDPRIKGQKGPKVDMNIKPILLNHLEDEYLEIKVKYGLAPRADAKPKMISLSARPESQMSLRMQSRLKGLETQKKRRDEEIRIASQMSRRSNKVVSRYSQSYIQQTGYIRGPTPKEFEQKE
ncbi:hypothetical protein GPJ56_004739 [Histomonas meleagridis]|uniref:uncharacterized protein n=1 Tax=Histomonas meleagridis TaxID=135588 RepID=UPI00355A974F|nr:hypothetical protein GPJ56_004739 [Histomonas meleagridis]KAH0799519.1 hypothetical protein GO595_007587 [Histomonas meleagridis]